MTFMRPNKPMGPKGSTGTTHSTALDKMEAPFEINPSRVNFDDEVCNFVES